MNILGIDTSCDDTSAAVVRDGLEICSMIVTSQDAFHARYGGIVPEIASRQHVNLITVTIQHALEKAGLGLDDIDGIAVTQRPGLIGSLVVGIAAAKAIAFVKKIPLTGINHIHGHAYAPVFNNTLRFPHLALVVSGGHTLTARIDDAWHMTIIGHTRDDAAGECLDKVAKMLGLGYPGGRIIDELARTGNASRHAFPRPMVHDGSPHFSFSGLKTSVRQFLERCVTTGEDIDLPDLLASIQEAVMDVLVLKSMETARAHGLDLITVSGGVAANSRLRSLFLERTASHADLEVVFPTPPLCTDNAAVIGGLGYHWIQRGEIAGLSLNAHARMDIRLRGKP